MAQQFSIIWITPLNELWMTKYIKGEIFHSGGATLYKNPSDQTVCCLMMQLPFFLDRLYTHFSATHLDPASSILCVCLEFFQAATGQCSGS